MDPISFKYIAVGLMAFAFLGAAIGIGLIFSATVTAVARNPSVEGKIFKYAIIGAAFAEAMGLFALVLSFILIFG